MRGKLSAVEPCVLVPQRGFANDPRPVRDFDGVLELVSERRNLLGLMVSHRTVPSHIGVGPAVD